MSSEIHLFMRGFLIQKFMSCWLSDLRRSMTFMLHNGLTIIVRNQVDNEPV
jgi:hypothetical protein